MRIGLKIKAENGKEIAKTLEEITSDAEAAQKQFLFEEHGEILSVCIGKVISHYKDPTDFANEVNYYRQFTPNARYAKTHPIKVRFYK